MTKYIATNIDGAYLGDGDMIPFCSDWCRDDYALDKNWDSSFWLDSDENDFNEYCACCGVVLPGMEDSNCECVRDNFVVARFLSEDGDLCEHGNWIQLPAANVKNMKF